MRYVKYYFLILILVPTLLTFAQTRKTKETTWEMINELQFFNLESKRPQLISNSGNKTIAFIIPGTFDQLSTRLAKSYSEIARNYGFNFVVITMEIEATIDLELLENIPSSSILLDTTASILLEFGYEKLTKNQLNKYLGFGYNLPKILKQDKLNCKMPLFNLIIFDTTKPGLPIQLQYIGKDEIPNAKKLEKILKSKQYLKQKTSINGRI